MQPVLLGSRCYSILTTVTWVSFLPLRCVPSFFQALRWLKLQFTVCYILIEAGYFIKTDKLQHVPSTVVCFLFCFVCFFFYGILSARRFLFPRLRRLTWRPCGKVFCHPPVSVLRLLPTFAGALRKKNRARASLKP